MNHFWLIAVALALLVLAPFALIGEDLALVFSSEGAVGLAASGRDVGWFWGISLLVADLFAPIPTTGVIAGLGVLYGPFSGAAVSFVGMMTAALVGYGIGRIFGRPVADCYLGPEASTHGERIFARHGGWIVAASRWTPVLPEVVSVMAGVARMPLPAFAAAAACGTAPLCLAFAALGWAGSDRPSLTMAVAALAPLVLWFTADRLGITKQLGKRD